MEKMKHVNLKKFSQNITKNMRDSKFIDFTKKEIEKFIDNKFYIRGLSSSAIDKIGNRFKYKEESILDSLYPVEYFFLDGRPFALQHSDEIIFFSKEITKEFFEYAYSLLTVRFDLNELDQIKLINNHEVSLNFEGMENISIDVYSNKLLYCVDPDVLKKWPKLVYDDPYCVDSLAKQLYDQRKNLVFFLKNDHEKELYIMKNNKNVKDKMITHVLKERDSYSDFVYTLDDCYFVPKAH